MNYYEFYEKQLSENDNEISKVGWHDIEKANKRYKFAADLIMANGGGNVLDVGCGLGIFRSYVPECDYIGVDIYPPYINLAKGIKDTSFYLGTVDSVVKEHNLEVDNYVSLGAYTIIHENITNVEKYVFEEISFMLSKAKKSVIINGFHNVVDSKDYKFYHSLDSLVKFSQKYNDTHKISLHIFSKYEFFLQFILSN